MILDTDWHQCTFQAETIYDKKLLNELFESLKNTWASTHNDIMVEYDTLHNINILTIHTYE